MKDKYLNLYGGPLSGIGGEVMLMGKLEPEIIYRAVVFLYRIKEGGFYWVSPNYTDPYGPGYPDTRVIDEEVSVVNQKDGTSVFLFANEFHDVYLTNPTDPAVLKSLANFEEYLKKVGRTIEEERELQRLDKTIPGEMTLI